MSDPPSDLRRDGKALWRRVQAWMAELAAEKGGEGAVLKLDPHESLVLAEACRTVDRLAQLRKALSGIDLATDAAAVRLLAEERMQRAALASLLLVRLGLPTGVADETQSKGSSAASRRAQTAAAARWRPEAAS